MTSSKAAEIHATDFITTLNNCITALNKMSEKSFFLSRYDDVCGVLCFHKKKTSKITNMKPTKNCEKIYFFLSMQLYCSFEFSVKKIFNHIHLHKVVKRSERA